MKVFELASQFFADILRLPFMFKVILLWGVAASIWQWLKRRKEAQIQADALGWPAYEARVVHAQVSDRTKEGRHGDYYWEGLLTYSYTVPDHELEVGEYRKRFESVEEADAWASGLRDTSITVRIDPTDAKQSRWLDNKTGTQVPVDRPLFTRSTFVLPPLRNGKDLAAWAILCASGTGALLALWVQLSSLVGRSFLSAKENTGAFFGMHVGAILCAIASSAFMATKPAPGQVRPWGKSMKKLSADTPSLKVIGAYVTVIFFYGWVRMAAQDGQPDKWSSIMFSAVWFFFYIISATACWRYLIAIPESSTQNWE